jgi:peptidoglycan/LPS O-acetylase OafA/YrhL
VKYRPDIDGLRALAIVPVVFYHANVAFFSGGFVGVDVFFVISGFLITGLILFEMEAGSLSIMSFYERRIRRICPALFVVMAFCAVIGWLWMAPDAYQALGSSICAAALSASNFLFWDQSGYFDTATHEKPLLHTWSLGVEEQFYLFFPVYLLLITRLLPAARLRITFAICAASFALSVPMAYRYPVTAFFLGPTRIWELGLGALLAMNAVPVRASSRWHNLASVGGVTLIAIAIFTYSPATVFPGAAALLPTLGTAAVIWGGAHSSSVFNTLLARPVPAFIGKISYSLYLWHFPLLAFAKYFSVGELGAVSRVSLVGISVGLAVLSWAYIEGPIRARVVLPNSRALFATAIASFCAMLALGGAIDLTKGFSQRLAPDRLELLAGARDFNPDRDDCVAYDLAQVARRAFCHLGVQAGTPRFVLWGDSHAEALRRAITEAAKHGAVTGNFAGRNGCAPILGLEPRGFRCREINELVMSYVLSNASIDTVILSARWGLWSEGTDYKPNAEKRFIVEDSSGAVEDSANNHSLFAKGLENTVARLIAGGKSVWLIGPIPEVGYNVPKSLYLQKVGFDNDIRIAPTTLEFSKREQFIFSTFRALEERFPIKVIWPHEAMCDANECRVEVEGRPLYSDGHHLSVTGARYIAPQFIRLFTEERRSAGTEPSDNSSVAARVEGSRRREVSAR